MIIQIFTEDIKTVTFGGLDDSQLVKVLRLVDELTLENSEESEEEF